MLDATLRQDMIREGQCSDTAAGAAGTRLTAEALTQASLPPACLAGLVCSYLGFVALSCSFRVLCENSVSGVTWREIGFSPIFLNVSNAVIFISRAYLDKKVPQVAYPLRIQLSMDIGI